MNRGLANFGERSDRPGAHRCERASASERASATGLRGRGTREVMKALQMRRSVPRLGLARIASAIGPSAAARVAPLEYRNIDPPELPGAGWHRVRTRLSGICGSDLSMIEGHASTYFDDVVSFPFVPGHEVVGELDDGTRVAIEPVLGHAARGFPLPFDGAAPGDGDDYGHLTAAARVWAVRMRRASRPGSARRPVAAGRRSSSPTTASCTASATCPTSAPC